jgi:methyltransferase (TIGR00027 family)
MQIQNISDTARWMAYIRAIESDRPDALFRDPYARELAGTLGAAIAKEIGDLQMIANGIAVRTAVLDQLILQVVERDEVDLVLNIGSGLDTRPWRLGLPAGLRWLDVDLPAILDHKVGIVRPERASCQYDALAADILEGGHRAVVSAHCASARCVLVVTEGLLVYLKPSQVETLARDLRDKSSCMWWLTDLTGPRALQMLRRVWEPKLRGAQFRFAPADSIEFFGRLGWHEHSFHSSHEEARRLNRATRTPWLSRLALMLASEAFREEFRRLSGVALLSRDTTPPSSTAVAGASNQSSAP